MLRQLDLFGRAADEYPRRVAPEVLRERTDIARRGAQVLDDSAHVVLIILEEHIQPIRGIIELLDEPVELAVVRDPAHVTGDYRYIIDRLLQRRVGQELVDARKC